MLIWKNKALFRAGHLIATLAYQRDGDPCRWRLIFPDGSPAAAFGDLSDVPLKGFAEARDHVGRLCMRAGMGRPHHQMSEACDVLARRTTAAKRASTDPT